MKTNKPITTRAGLQDRLDQLREERERLESSITKNSSETYKIITNPAPIIKHAVADLAKDKQFKSDVLQIALHTAANYLGKKIAQSDIFSSFATAKETTQERKETSGSESSENTGKEPSLLKELFGVIKNRYAKD